MTLTDAVMSLTLLAAGAEPTVHPKPVEKPTLGQLLRECRASSLVTARGVSESAQEAADAGACSGYLGGFIEMGEVQMLLSTSRPYCHPEGTNYSQVAKLVVDWAEAHPEYLDEPRFVGVARAMRESYPCSPKSKPVLPLQSK